VWSIRSTENDEEHMKQCLILSALVLAANASAQPVDDTAKVDRASIDKAAALYDAGKRHFDIGEYAAAIASWKQSYLLSSEPLLLFNIGQAYRLAGNCAQANRFYLNYKRVVSKPENRAELEQAMAVCAGVEPATGDAAPPTADRRAEASQLTRSPEEAKPPAILPTETTAAPPRPPSTARPAAGAATSTLEHAPGPSDDGRNLRITGLVLGGAGVAAGVVAIVFGIQAADNASTVESQPHGTAWTGSLPENQSSGQAAETRARVFAAIGGVAILGGGVVWWLGHHAGTSRVDVAIAPSHAEVSWSCAF
jgi:hypothetical protein